MTSFANFVERNYANPIAAAAQFAHEMDAPDALNATLAAARQEGFHFDHQEVEIISVSLNQKRDSLKRSGWSR